MKRFLLAILAITFLMGGVAWGAGTCVQQSVVSYPSSTSPLQKALTVTCTADASTANFPTMAINATNTAALKGWYLYKVQTNPGATAPTDNWDFTITDSDGIDVLQGAGANRHTTTSQRVSPTYYEPLLGTWTLAITDSSNLVNSAVIAFTLFFVR